MGDVMDVDDTAVTTKPADTEWLNETATVRWGEEVRFTGSVPIPWGQILETNTAHLWSYCFADGSAKTFFLTSLRERDE